MDPVTVKTARGHEFNDGVRWIRTVPSKDFLTLTWTHLQDIDTGDTPLEHLYNNECWGYDRAPGTYLIFPSRYVAHRMPDPYWYVRISLNDSDLFAFRFR